MKILKIDRFKSSVELIPETRDDLWHLSHVVEVTDLVRARTTRKIKGKEGEQTIREKMRLEIEVKEIEFGKFTGSLRLHGVIRGGKPVEFVDLGSAHSIEVENGKKIFIKKKILRNDQLERLKKAQKATHKKPVLVVVLDDEVATIALMKEFGLEEKGTIHSGKSGKQFEHGDWKKQFYGDISKKVMDLNPDSLVLAGPGFAKGDLEKILKEKSFKGKIFTENTNQVGLTGVNELLKGQAFAKIVQDSELSREAMLIEKVMTEIGKGTGKATYGFREVENAIDVGAAEELLVLDTLLGKEMQKVRPLLDKAEALHATIHIFNSEHDPGRKLDGIGKIAALLRYKIE